MTWSGPPTGAARSPRPHSPKFDVWMPGAGSARRFAVSRSDAGTGARAVRRAWPRDQRRDQAVRRAGGGDRACGNRRWSTCGRGTGRRHWSPASRPCVLSVARDMAPELPRGYLAGTCRGGGGNGWRHTPAPRCISITAGCSRAAGRAPGRRHSHGAVYGQRWLARTTAPRGRRRSGHHRSRRPGAGVPWSENRSCVDPAGECSRTCCPPALPVGPTGVAATDQ